MFSILFCLFARLRYATLQEEKRVLQTDLTAKTVQNTDLDFKNNLYVSLSDKFFMFGSFLGYLSY